MTLRSTKDWEMIRWISLRSLVEIALLLDQSKIETYIEDSRFVRNKHLVFLLFPNSRICPKQRPETDTWGTKERARKKHKGTKIRPKIIRQIIVNDRSENILERSSCSIERSLARILNWKSCFQTYNKNTKTYTLSRVLYFETRSSQMEILSVFISSRFFFSGKFFFNFFDLNSRVYFFINIYFYYVYMYTFHQFY